MFIRIKLFILLISAIFISNVHAEPYIEGGYGKLIHHGKLKHFENIDFDKTTMTTTQGYNNRKLKNSDAFYLLYGFKLNEKFRVNLEYIHTGKSKLNVVNSTDNNQFDNYKLSVKQQALLLNLNYHPVNEKYGFLPYIGIGVGITNNKVSPETISLNYINDPVIDGIRFKSSSKRFAYSLQAGTYYKITDNIYLNFGYKFINFGKVKGNKLEYNNSFNVIDPPQLTNIKGKLQSHLYMIGIGYQF